VNVQVEPSEDDGDAAEGPLDRGRLRREAIRRTTRRANETVLERTSAAHGEDLDWGRVQREEFRRIVERAGG
jgi:hypothetical protein